MGNGTARSAHAKKPRQLQAGQRAVAGPRGAWRGAAMYGSRSWVRSTALWKRDHSGEVFSQLNFRLKGGRKREAPPRRRRGSLCSRNRRLQTAAYRFGSGKPRHELRSSKFATLSRVTRQIDPATVAYIQRPSADLCSTGALRKSPATGHRGAGLRRESHL
jgi:hypothetical protein